MRVHVCPLDADCRKWGTPWRAHLFAKHWEVGIAFRPGDRFVGKMNSKYKWFYVERKT